MSTHQNTATSHMSGATHHPSKHLHSILVVIMLCCLPSEVDAQTPTERNKYPVITSVSADCSDHGEVIGCKSVTVYGRNFINTTEVAFVRAPRVNCPSPCIPPTCKLQIWDKEQRQIRCEIDLDNGYQKGIWVVVVVNKPRPIVFPRTPTPSAPIPTPSPPPPAKGWLAWWIILIILLVVLLCCLALIYFCWTFSRKKTRNDEMLVTNYVKDDPAYSGFPDDLVQTLLAPEPQPVGNELPTNEVHHHHYYHHHYPPGDNSTIVSGDQSVIIGGRDDYEMTEMAKSPPHHPVPTISTTTVVDQAPPSPYNSTGGQPQYNVVTAGSGSSSSSSSSSPDRTGSPLADAYRSPEAEGHITMPYTGESATHSTHSSHSGHYH
eukprot:TRINITY_DN104122_c0_g1_i1.p1 TRINITY_DN104122_c0_g1~~TRINITY_DN104122_c0_g1_i1.p1  ORF type:complete len:377 (-),score=33.49 TRINITY_DN104122_c0_g1_i1:287-1417(-)